jgi:hypothetical protein
MRMILSFCIEKQARKSCYTRATVRSRRWHLEIGERVNPVTREPQYYRQAGTSGINAGAKMPDRPAAARHQVPRASPPPARILGNRLRARASRDMTVPIGTLVRSEISR